jgi:hypothetical protein
MPLAQRSILFALFTFTRPALAHRYQPPARLSLLSCCGRVEMGHFAEEKKPRSVEDKHKWRGGEWGISHASQTRCVHWFSKR